VVNEAGERRAERNGRTSIPAFVPKIADWIEAVTRSACVLALAVLIIAISCVFMARCVFDRPSYCPEPLSSLVLRGRDAVSGAAAVVRQDRGAISVTFTAHEPIERQAIGAWPSGERGL
jgi:hypothetical protein